jgi:hypothetical protein
LLPVKQLCRLKFLTYPGNSLRQTWLMICPRKKPSQALSE